MNEPVEDGDFVILIRDRYNRIYRSDPLLQPGLMYRVKQNGDLFYLISIDGTDTMLDDIGFWSYTKVTQNLFKII